MIPKTNSGAIFLGVNNGGGGNFECEIGNFAVEHVAAAFQPLYTAVFNNATDYYSFGSPMPGRRFQSGTKYRYDFNGKESDLETVGTAGGTQDYGLRIYNPSLGKFLSIDPLADEYPWNSTYAFAENDVIRCVDLDGAEKSQQTIVINGKTGALIHQSNIEELPEPGPLGDGHSVYIIKRFFYEDGTGASWDTHDVADDQYSDEVLVGPPYNVADETEKVLKTIDGVVSRNMMGSIDNYGVDEGDEGRQKWTEKGHSAMSMIGRVPVLKPAADIFDGIITATEIAAEVEKGNGYTATAIGVNYVAGKLISGAVEKAIPESATKGLKGKVTEEVIGQGVDKVVGAVQDAILDKAKEKDEYKK